TMIVGSASVPTHLVDARLITKIGRFLRASKLDELPQLFNVFRGHMSLVGPRPCLPSQLELIDERRARGVFRVRPGVTGLAQISGIDMSTPVVLAEVDSNMCRNLGLKMYFRMLAQTALGRGRGDRIRL
ncbi:MAG: sugar transferase, partial [Proteobacteria bacterium]|nr:sugar transferase [Pseudomonadota bacterium]